MRKIFTRKKLLIISGPTASGKTTFRKSLQGSQQAEFAKGILDVAFRRGFSSIETLRMKGIRRCFGKKNGFQKLMCSGRNFVLELDSTCPFTIANLILFPSLLKEFDRITVVHSYVPIDVWVERIHERRLGGFKTSEYVDQVVSLYHQSAKKAARAHDIYHEFYSNFESFFDGLGVKEQMCINAQGCTSFVRPYPFG